MSVKYAMAAIVTIARRDREGPELLRDVSLDTGVPRDFLAKIARNLVKAGILTSTRGRGGGVRLARRASDIPLAQVVRAVDGPDALDLCAFGRARGQCTRRCAYYGIWNPVREMMRGFLEKTTVHDLASLGEARVRQPAARSCGFDVTAVAPQSRRADCRT